MVSSRVKSKSAARSSNKVTIKIITQEPDSLIGVKTSRVYSQIARMSRDPRKQTERAFLITVLEESSVTTTVNGKTVKKDPPFVAMKAADVNKCFGRQVEKLPDASFFHLSKA